MSNPFHAPPPRPPLTAFARDGLHVVIGGLGAVGRAVVGELKRRNLTLRLVTRLRRTAPDDAGVPLVVGDMRDTDFARHACRDATVVYHCAGVPLTEDWTRELPALMDGVIAGAATAGARVVYADNLFVYGPSDVPLNEERPWDAHGSAGLARAAVARQLLVAHGAGALRATIGRASDLFGPHVVESFAGHRLFNAALRGRPAALVGNIDLPHTLTYVEDFARALVTLGEREVALGHLWHVPSAETITFRRFAELVYAQAGTPLRLRVASRRVVAALALFSPTMRRVRQVMGQLSAPFTVDDRKYRAAFGSQVTPHRMAIHRTLDWYARNLETTGVATAKVRAAPVDMTTDQTGGSR